MTITIKLMLLRLATLMIPTIVTILLVPSRMVMAVMDDNQLTVATIIIVYMTVSPKLAKNEPATRLQKTRSATL